MICKRVEIQSSPSPFFQMTKKKSHNSVGTYKYGRIIPLESTVSPSYLWDVFDVYGHLEQYNITS